MSMWYKKLVAMAIKQSIKPSFDGVSCEGSVVEPWQHPATALKVYDCHTDSTFHWKLQLDWEKDYFGPEEVQMRFSNACGYDSHSIHEETIYSFFSLCQ